MELANLIVLSPILALVLFPLVREYVDFRETWGFGRMRALATTLLVVPALVLGLSTSLALAQPPALQWTMTVVVTFAAYSIATAAVRPLSASESPHRSS